MRSAIGSSNNRRFALFHNTDDFRKIFFLNRLPTVMNDLFFGLAKPHTRRLVDKLAQYLHGIGQTGSIQVFLLDFQQNVLVLIHYLPIRLS